MSIMNQVHLNKFKPRSYQIPIMDAILNKGYKRVLCILPRRAGKDVCAFNIMIRAALKKIGVYYYIFPTYSQGKKILWDSLTNDGLRFLDYIPRELIESTNSQEMKIKMTNGSLIQVIGSDNVDSLVGTNPQGIVFSEYALQDPRVYQFLRPILVLNQGFCLFISTPRGKNHLFTLYEVARQSQEWFCLKLSINETMHIPLSEIEKEKAEGLMSDDLIQQEYFCSFDMGIEGSYYAKYLDRMRVKGQIGQVPWEAGFKVHTAWDIGVRDSTTVLFFQVIGQTVRIIDCYENSKVGLEHYVKVIQQRPYSYGKHIAPHDIKVREFGSGMTRWEKAKQLGITFIIAPDLSIEDGIEATRSALSKIWIDESCSSFIKAIENYRQEYDHKRKIYKDHPLHDWSSHWCFTADTLILTSSGIKQIKDINQGDYILTLRGFKRCLNSGMTRRDAELVEVSFEDGTKVRCTGDHLFLTVNGWKSAKSLEKGILIQSSLMQLPNTLREVFIECIQAQNITQAVQEDYIKRFGNQFLDLSQRIVTFITRIMMSVITHFGTLSAFLSRSILRFRGLIIKDSALKLAMQLQIGIDLKREGCGIVFNQSDLKDGQNGKKSHEYVFIAPENLKQSSGRMDMIKNSVIRTAKLPTIEGVRFLNQREDVFDIEVEDEHHFSLANGAIVHNCDTLRYLCISLPKTRDGLSAEELDRRYQEAVYGSSSNLPAIFRDDIS